MLMVTMSKLLSQLLGAGEPMFSIALNKLEHAGGSLGVDVKLTADIIEAKGHALKALGLDVQDTNGPELYAALLHLARKHDAFLAKRLGVADPADVGSALEAVVRAAQNARVPHDAWVIKRSVLKRLLKAQPPKVVMKRLGYRSLESLLKREAPELVIATARMVETDAWQRKFVARYAKLTPQDFEQRGIEIVHPTSAKWRLIAAEYVARNFHNVAHAKEAGLIVVLPLDTTSLPGVTLAVLPRTLHYINEIRMYGAYFKLCQILPEFGKIVALTIQEDPAEHVRIAGQAIHWRIIHRHFGRQDVLPELFEPHVAPEDMTWQPVTRPLIALEPALSFWEPLEHSGAVMHDQIVSLHIMDVAEAALNQLPYDARTFRHMRRSLWCELYARYVASPVIHAQVISQLQRSASEPALVILSQK